MDELWPSIMFGGSEDIVVFHIFFLLGILGCSKSVMAASRRGLVF
jgi:hypothetical protein